MNRLKVRTCALIPVPGATVVHLHVASDVLVALSSLTAASGSVRRASCTISKPYLPLSCSFQRHRGFAYAHDHHQQQLVHPALRHILPDPSAYYQVRILVKIVAIYVTFCKRVNYRLIFCFPSLVTGGGRAGGQPRKPTF